MLKKASWTTSAGFADFYVFQTTSPDFKEYSTSRSSSSTSDRSRPSPQEWDALGLRGNQSGSLLIDWKFMPENQLCRPDRRRRLRRTTRRSTRTSSSAPRACWNGISLGAIDIACQHTTRKTHKDVGLRVCDYPTIQDAVGEAIIDTNADRAA